MSYSSMSPEELIRLCAQSTGDHLAWSEFIQRYNRLIVGVIFRTAHQWGEESPEVVDDLVQETYLKLCADQCRLLRNFESVHEGSIFGYLKVIAAHVAHDRFRSLHADKRSGDLNTEDIDSAEAVRTDDLFRGQEAMERAILLEEIDSFLEAKTPGPQGQRDRMVFWLYYRQGMTAQAIAALPSIDLSAKGVESTIVRLKQLVRSEMVEGCLIRTKG